MQAHVVTRIVIGADRIEVFKYLGDLRYHLVWNPHIQQISPIIKLRSGVTYQASSLMFGSIKIQSRITVTKLIVDRQLELHNDTGTLQYDLRYRLEADGDSTRLICSTTVTSLSNAFAFTKPVLRLLAQRELQADLHLLKVAVEQKLT